jgi:hypothetical protein
MIRSLILGALVAALMVVMWLVLPNIYEGAAPSPNNATGQVWELNNHGRIVYVTQLEKLIQSVVTPVLFILTIGAGALAFMGRRRRGAEAGEPD